MFSPTASSAITSASMPTCSWKPPRPSSGRARPTNPAIPSLGPPPSRSALRCASPSQDGRYSRRCACLATHSSAPTFGPCGSTLIGTSYLLQLGPADPPAGPYQHHDDQEPEHEQVAVGGVAGTGHDRSR